MTHPRFVPSLFIFILTVCPLLFFTDLTRNPFYTQITLLHIAVSMLWILWLVDALRRGEWVHPMTPVGFPLAAWIFWGGITWAYSFRIHEGVRMAVLNEGARAVFFSIVNVFLVYTTAVRFADEKWFSRFRWITYGVSTLAAGYGILQFYGLEPIWPRELNPYGGRPVSTFGNPNFLSSYLVLSMAALLTEILVASRGRLFLIGLLMVQGGGLVCTLTRSSWAGLAAACVFIAWGVLRDRSLPVISRKRFWFVTALLLLLALAWPKSPFQSRSPIHARLSELISVRTHEPYGPVHQRLLIWSSVWHMVMEHPYMGKGAGCLELFYPFYQGPQLFSKTLRSLRTHANNAHNEVLEHWSQIGSIGLGLFLWLLVVLGRSGVSVVQRLSGPPRALAWGILGGSVGMLVDNLLNVSLHFAVPAMLFWMNLGFLWTWVPEGIRSHRWSLAPLWRKGIVCGVLVALAWSIAHSARGWWEEVCYFKGFKLSKEGRALPAAAAWLERARRFHRYEVNNNYELGNVYARLGEREKAIAAYDEALRSNAGYDEIHFNKGTILAQLGRMDEAIQSYRIALHINPLSRDLYNALSVLYVKDLRRYDDAAVSLFKQALGFFPEDKEILNNFGYVLVQRNDYEQAFEVYHRAVKADPDYEMSRRNLRYAAQKLGKTDNPLLQLDALMGQLEERIQKQNWKEALPIAEKIVSIAPRSGKGQMFLGNVLLAMGKPAEAIPHLQEATRLQPDASGPWQNLGLAFLQLKRLGDARSAFQETLRLNPQNAVAQQYLDRRSDVPR